MKTVKEVGYYLGLMVGSIGLGYGWGKLYSKLLANKLLDE